MFLVIDQPINQLDEAKKVGEVKEEPETNEAQRAVVAEVMQKEGEETPSTTAEVLEEITKANESLKQSETPPGGVVAAVEPKEHTGAGSWNLFTINNHHTTLLSVPSHDMNFKHMTVA